MAWQLSSTPVPQVLFRPEEVIIASGAAPVDDGLIRGHASQRSVRNADLNPVHTMGAGVVEGQRPSPVLAADQQQEVHGSGYSEPLSRIQSHRMEGKPKPIQQALVTFVKGVVSGAPAILDEKEVDQAQHAEGTVNTLNRETENRRCLLGAGQ